MFLFASMRVQAQFEHLLGKTHAERYIDLRKFVDRGFNRQDTAATYRSIATLRKVATAAGDRELVLEADYLQALFDLDMPSIPRKHLLSELQGLLRKAEEANVPQITIRAKIAMRHYYWHLTKNYEKAFEEYFEIYQLLQKVTPAYFPEKAVTLSYMGDAHYYFADYANAIRYSREALQVAVIQPHKGVHNNARNTIGLSYVKLGRLDSADVYFKEIIDNVGIDDYAVWKGIAQGSLGLTAYLRGDYDRAEPYLQDNIRQALLVTDLDQAGKSLTTLADIQFRKGQVAKAAASMQQARQCISRSHQEKPLEQLFQVYAKVYAARGQLDLTSVYLDSANMVRARFEKEFNTMQMLRATERSQLQAHRAAMAKVAAERQIKTLERNVLLILVLLFAVVALYFYKTYYYKSQERQRKVSEQLKRAEQELNFASIQLEEFTRSISEKNLLVEELTAKYGAQAGEEAIQQLQNLTILTDEQWDYFRTLFDKAHVGYLSRLREKIPTLTPAETRFMALAKLNLTSKEMASSLGISVQSVRVIRHRIRKKLDLPEEADITQLVGSI